MSKRRKEDIRINRPIIQVSAALRDGGLGRGGGARDRNVPSKLRCPKIAENPKMYSEKFVWKCQALKNVQ